MTTPHEDDPLRPLVDANAGADDWDVDRLWSRVRADTIEAAGRPARTRPMIPMPRRSRTPLVAAAALLAAGVIGVMVLKREGPPAPAAPGREYATGIGQRATVHLADGSTVILAPASHLTIPGTFGAASREVVLRGQASFEIRHDERAPFRVRAGAGTIEDVGTRFDVRAYDSSRVVVIVSEGEVALRHAMDSTTAPIHLVAGQSGTIGATQAMRETRAASETAWTDGRLVFTSQPLAEVLESLSRWYDLDIRASESLRDRRVTAEFAADRPQDMIASLATAVGAIAAQSGKRVTLTPRGR